MDQRPDDRLLRWSLRANAAFSSACAALALAAAGRLARTLGVPEPGMLVALGVQLLVWAGLLLALAARPRIRPALALAVVAADALWVVGMIPLVLAGGLTAAGVWTALALADVVAAFAVLQLLGIRRARGTLRPRTA